MRADAGLARQTGGRWRSSWRGSRLTPQQKPTAPWRTAVGAGE